MNGLVRLSFLCGWIAIADRWRNVAVELSALQTSLLRAIDPHANESRQLTLSDNTTVRVKP
jgi:hypothetical protein